MLIPAYFISSIIETPVIFLFVRKKIKNPWINSLKISFIANMFSYILLFLFILIGAYLTYLPANSFKSLNVS